MKPAVPMSNARGVTVAPLAGAWIETPLRISSVESEVSPLSRGRGLKLRTKKSPRLPHPSPLSRGRGLKLEILYHCGLRVSGRPSRGGVD